MRVIPHVRIYAGGTRRRVSLPRLGNVTKLKNGIKRFVLWLLRVLRGETIQTCTSNKLLTTRAGVLTVPLGAERPCRRSRSR